MARDVCINNNNNIRTKKNSRVAAETSKFGPRGARV